MKRISVNGATYGYSVGPDKTVVFGPDFVTAADNASIIGESLEGVPKRLRDKKMKPYIRQIIETSSPIVVANRQMANCFRRKQKKIDRACTYKIRYMSALAAEDEVKKGRTRGYLKHSARKYKCPYCPGWHVTNKGKAQ